MNSIPTHKSVQGTLAQARMRLVALPQLRHWILVPAVMAAAVLALGFSVKRLPRFTSMEFTIDQEISSQHNGILNVVALTTDKLFGNQIGAVLLAAGCLYLLLIRRSPVNSIAFGAVNVAGWLSCHLVKVAVARPRPDQALLADPLITAPASYSFPSGQVSLATTLAFTLYYLARKTKWQRPVLVFSIFLVLFVALSRLYLGAHYPTDVFASMVTAAATVLFFAGLWNTYAVAVISRMTLLTKFGPIPRRARDDANP